MISNIQLLRALAAMAVVYFHGSYIFGGVHADFKAVAIFFVVSGFIMTLISRERSEGFLINRITRVVPLYWICTIAFFLLINLELFNPLYKIPQIWEWILHDQNTLAWYLSNKTGFGDSQLRRDLVRSLLFLPYRNAQGFMFPVLGVGWTLNLEMYFYAIFAACLMFSVRWAPVLTAVVIIAVKVMAWTHFTSSELLAFYSDRYTGFFVLGIAAFYAWKECPRRISQFTAKYRWPIGVILAVALTVFNCFPLREIKAHLTYAPAMALYFMLPFAAVMFALLLHAEGVRLSSRLIGLLGDASFSIYLTHPFVAMIVETTLKQYPMAGAARTAAFVLFMTACAVVGIATHRAIERPLLRYARRFSPIKSSANAQKQA